jgi:hypothetical protein
MPVNNILVLRESSSVEKLSGSSDLSLQGVNFEDIPRPVPMHTLLKAKEHKRHIVDTNSHGLYVLDAHPLEKK